MGGLIGYRVLSDLPRQGGESQGALFDYVLGANGVFLQARSERLAVSFRVAAPQCELRGLRLVNTTFNLRAPKVPAGLLSCILGSAACWGERAKETLFHLSYSDLYPPWNGWALTEPAQDRTRTSCRPLEDGAESSHDRALIEIHSHHSMPARFSPQDDLDETGFRIYAVIGDLPAWRISVRVGAYGHFWAIPATWIFEDLGQVEDTCPVAVERSWDVFAPYVIGGVND